MPTRLPLCSFCTRPARWLRPGLLAVLLGAGMAAVSAQSNPIRPDSVVVPSAAPPDTLRPAAVAEPPPDADPTPGPVSARARWAILGACALLTLSTLLLYNVRSR
ncbi:hypothetical protein GCM10027048_07630 [Hymenobacter coalescens]